MTAANDMPDPFEENIVKASASLTEGLRGLSRSSWVNRLLIYLIIPSLLFDIGLTYWVHSTADSAGANAHAALVATNKANAALKVAEKSGATEKSLCLSGNVTRRAEIAYFTYLFHLTPSHKRTATENKEVQAVLTYTDHIFAPRHCH